MMLNLELITLLCKTTLSKYIGQTCNYSCHAAAAALRVFASVLFFLLM